MKYPVDSLASVDPEALEQSAKDYMSKLLYRKPEIYESLSLPDSKQIEIGLCNVGFVPLYGDGKKQKILALFLPENIHKAVGLYLLDQWWSAEDILKTGDSSRTGLLEVKTFGERIVLYVLNRIIYRQREQSSDDISFLLHGEHEMAKIFWKDGEAIGFYSVKPEGSLCPKFVTQQYQLPILDSIFIRKCYRGKGCGLQILDDFVRSFKAECMGLKYPLPTAMYKVCKNYLSTNPADEKLLWEVKDIGAPFQRTSVALKLQTMELKEDHVTERLHFETENTDVAMKKVITQAQKTTVYTEEVVEEVVQIKITKEVQDTPVTTRGRSSNLKCKKLDKDTGATTEKIIRVEDIEAGVQPLVYEPVPEIVVRTTNVQEADGKDITVTVTHGEAHVLDVTHIHCEHQELASAPEECVLEVCAPTSPTTEPATVTPEEALEKTDMLQLTRIAEIQTMTSSEKAQIVKSLEATTDPVSLQPLELQQVVEIVKMTSGVEMIKEKPEEVTGTKDNKNEFEEEIAGKAVADMEAKVKSNEITFQEASQQYELDLKPDTMHSVESSTTDIRVLRRTGEASTGTPQRMSTRLHKELHVTSKLCQLEAETASKQKSMKRSKAVQQEESGQAVKEKKEAINIFGDANEACGNITKIDVINEEKLREKHEFIPEDILKSEDIKTVEKVRDSEQEEAEMHSEQKNKEESSVRDSAEVMGNETSEEQFQPQKDAEQPGLDGITSEDQEIEPAEKQKAERGEVKKTAMDENVVGDPEEREEKKTENMAVEDTLLEKDPSVLWLSLTNKEHMDQMQDEEHMKYISICEKEKKTEVQEPSHVEVKSYNWTEPIQEAVEDLDKQVPDKEETEMEEVVRPSDVNKEETSDNWTELSVEKDSDLVDNSGSPGRSVDGKRSKYATQVRRSARGKGWPAESELTERVLRSGKKSVTAISRQKYVRHDKTVRQQEESAQAVDDPELEHIEDVMESHTEVAVGEQSGSSEGDKERLITHQGNIEEESKMEKEYLEPETCDDVMEVDRKMEDISQNETTADGDKLAGVSLDDVEVAEIQIEGKTTLQSTGETDEDEEEQPVTAMSQKDDEQKDVGSTSVFTLQNATVVLVDLNKVSPKQTDDTEEETTEIISQSEEVLDQELDTQASTKEIIEEQKESLVEPAEKDRTGGIETSTETAHPQEEDGIKKADVAEKEDVFTEMSVEEPITLNLEEQVMEPAVDRTLHTNSEKGESVMSEELKEDKVGEIALEEESAASVAEAFTTESETNQKEKQESTTPGHVDTPDEETPVVTSRSLRQRTVTVISTPQRKSKHLQKTEAELSETENVQMVEVMDKSDKGSTEEIKENKDETLEIEDSAVSKEDKVPILTDKDQGLMEEMQQEEPLNDTRTLKEVPDNEETEMKEVSTPSRNDGEETSDNWTELSVEKDSDLVDNSGSPGRSVDGKRSKYATQVRRSARGKGWPAESELTERVLRSGKKSVTAISRQKYVRHDKTVRQQEESAQAVDDPELEHIEDVMESHTEVAVEEQSESSEGDKERLITHQGNIEEESKMEKEYLEPETCDDVMEVDRKMEDISQNETTADGDKLAGVSLDDVEVAEIQIEGKTTLQSTGETDEDEEEQPVTAMSQKDDEQKDVGSTSVFTLQNATVVLVDLNKVSPKQTDDTEEETTEIISQSEEVLDQELDTQASTKEIIEEQKESLVEPAEKDRTGGIETSTETAHPQEEDGIKKADVAEKEDVFTEMSVEEPITLNLEEQVMEPAVDRTLHTNSEKGESVMSEELKEDKVGEIALEEESAASVAEAFTTESETNQKEKQESTTPGHVDTPDEETPVVTSRSLRQRTVTVISTPQRKSRRSQKTEMKTAETEIVQVNEVVYKIDEGSTKGGDDAVHRTHQGQMEVVGKVEAVKETSIPQESKRVPCHAGETADANTYSQDEVLKQTESFLDPLQKDVTEIADSETAVTANEQRDENVEKMETDARVVEDNEDRVPLREPVIETSNVQVILGDEEKEIKIQEPSRDDEQEKSDNQTEMAEVENTGMTIKAKATRQQPERSATRTPVKQLTDQPTVSELTKRVLRSTTKQVKTTASQQITTQQTKAIMQKEKSEQALHEKKEENVKFQVQVQEETVNVTSDEASALYVSTEEENKSEKDICQDENKVKEDIRSEQDKHAENVVSEESTEASTHEEKISDIHDTYITKVVQIEENTQVQSFAESKEVQEEEPTIEKTQNEDGQNSAEHTSVHTLEKAVVVLVDFKKATPKQTTDEASQSQEEVVQEPDQLVHSEEDKEEEKAASQTENDQTGENETSTETSQDKAEAQLLEETSEKDPKLAEDEKQLQEKEDKGSISAAEEILDEVEEVVEVERRSLRKRTITIKATKSKRMRKEGQEENPDQVQAENIEDPLPVEEQANVKLPVEKETTGQKDPNVVYDNDSDKELLSEKHQELENPESENTCGEKCVSEQEDTNKYKEHENESTDKSDLKADTLQEIKDSQEEAEKYEKNIEHNETTLAPDESFTLELDEEDENDATIEEMTTSLMEVASETIQKTDRFEEHITDEEEAPSVKKKYIISVRSSATATPEKRSTRRSNKFIQESLVETDQEEKKKPRRKTLRRSERLARPKIV